jgi:hypothetical protein
MKTSKCGSIVLRTLALCIMACASAFAQTDIVKSDGITGSLHRANVGRIVFTSKAVAAELAETDFLTTVDLNKTTDLSLRAFMANSLTNYRLTSRREFMPELDRIMSMDMDCGFVPAPVSMRLWDEADNASASCPQRT